MTAHPEGIDRTNFPAIDDWARFDAPGGTLVPDDVIAAMTAWMSDHGGANDGAPFAASIMTERLVDDTRATVGRMIAADPNGVVFAQSMTAITMRFATAVGRTLQPGDEIICTRLDHDANVRPWVIAAGRAGAAIEFASPDAETLDLRTEDVTSLITERTRWIAVTAASNAVGTRTPLAEIIAEAHRRGVKVYVDAVHASAHGPLDVGVLDPDAIASSAYKWFGPHVGVLWARPTLLRELDPDRVAPSTDEPPASWEQGTPQYEALAGMKAAAEHVIATDWPAVVEHERDLLDHAVRELDQIDGVRLYGRPTSRTATLMFNIDGLTPQETSVALAAQKIATYHGNYYAYELERFLGLDPLGAVRAGFVKYTSLGDVDRLIDAIRELARPHPT